MDLVYLLRPTMSSSVLSSFPPENLSPGALWALWLQEDVFSLPNDALRLAGLYLGLIFVMFFFGLGIAPRALTPKAREEFAHTVCFYPMNFGIVYYSFLTVFEHCGTMDSRWFGSGRARHHVLCSYTAVQVFGCLIILWHKMEHPLFLVHHVLSILAIGSGMFRDTVGYFASLSLLCECSTFFLSFVFLLKLEGSVSGGAAAGAKGTSRPVSGGARPGAAGGGGEEKSIDLIFYDMHQRQDS